MSHAPTRRVLAGVMVVAAIQLITASPAFAPHVAQLQVTPSTVAPGGQVSVYGPRGYGSTNPVEVRLGSVTGPVLGTFQPSDENFAQFGPGTVTIPPDTAPGTYRLVATQPLAANEQHIRGIPSATVIEVRAAGAAAAPPPPALVTEDRPDGLAQEAGVSIGVLIGVAVAAALVALAVGFAVAALAQKKSPTPSPSRTTR
jgi:hypothetical protein